MGVSCGWITSRISFRPFQTSIIPQSTTSCACQRILDTANQRQCQEHGVRFQGLLMTTLNTIERCGMFTETFSIHFWIWKTRFCISITIFQCLECDDTNKNNHKQRQNSISMERMRRFVATKHLPCQDISVELHWLWIPKSSLLPWNNTHWQKPPNRRIWEPLGESHPVDTMKEISSVKGMFPKTFLRW